MAFDIAAVRAAAGLSQRELARRAGTSGPTLHAYEHGTKSPTVSTLERIARAAGFEPELVLWPLPAGTDFTAAELAQALVTSSEDDRLRLMLEFLDRWAETPTDRKRSVVAT